MFPKAIWKIPNDNNKIYLTFDDGPSVCLEWILKTLKERSIKATFFCLGENLEKSDSVNSILAGGHQIANHSFGHEDGWKASRSHYLKSVGRCQELIDKLAPENKKLFRPPYGRITPGQIKSLKTDFKVIQWTLMAGDFDQGIDPARHVEKLIQKTRSGDIIVFHDNEKSKANLETMLPRYLDGCLDRGFEFGVIG